MKEKITRLTKAKITTDPENRFGGRFRVETNPDENDDELDISIHETFMASSVPDRDRIDFKTKKLLIEKVFVVRVNNDIPAKERFLTDVIVRVTKISGDAGYEIIYQFSIPFSRFNSRDNLITVSENTEEGLDNQVAYIEVFAEKEDNFINVRLERPGTESTNDQDLWTAIKSNLKFSEYAFFIDKILCGPQSVFKANNGAVFQETDRINAKNRSPFIRSDEYNLIKFGTEFYMMKRFGLDKLQIKSYLGSGKTLPYYDIIADRLKDDLIYDDDTEKEPGDNDDDCRIREFQRLNNPFMIELIWNYWMEQAGLVQTLNIINLRFQNIKTANLGDRLQRLDIDPLRPLSHILWGYIQDEQHRLSIPRRLNEYNHEYGLILTGKAVPPVRSIDPRVPFLEAFHNLLNQCIFYFRESDDTTRIADAFPILNSLKEVHLLLAEGNHNAYGNLTWTARQEMMMQQYILARPEMRDFLGGRTMVPYPETWMDRVDNMRSIQGWGGAGVMYYHELAIHGEQILLSIRYGNWSDVNLQGSNAANWAKEFRNSIQRYVHAYRAVTGVDLSVERVQLTESNYATQPAYLIQQRMATNSNAIHQRKLPSPLFRM